MDENTLKEKASRIRMLVLDVDGTLTDGGIYIDAHGVQSKKFNIRDGMGITLLHKAGIVVGMISNSSAQAILDERAMMLGIKYTYAGQEPKLEVLRHWMEILQLTFDHVAYIGDDVNDLEIIKSAGLSACPHDAHYSVIRAADIVLQRNGGEGCVREFIDRYLLAPPNP